jgi:hypothetical protein
MHNRKNQIAVVVLVFALLLFGATASFAAKGGMNNGQGHHGKQMFTAKGVVTAVEPAAFTMTITVEQANRILKDSIEDEVDFTVNENVRVKAACTDEFDLTLGEIAVGDTVRVMGRVLVDGANEIRQILIY